MTFTVVSIFSPRTLKIYGGVTQTSQQAVPISAAGLQGEESLVDRTMYDPIQGHCQVGSLTGAVHLSNNNGGVPRPAQCGQKPHIEQRANADLISVFSTHRDSKSSAYRSFWFKEFLTRGVRKVTTGITGLWRPSVHSDVAF
ncbi:hypothetical protein EVAR_64978_1 [Eumeta japonica]|uniref:Uncharacterized protein n=1 Tax=Eumeta variegata TaxID=151549 RepID=A0A4C1ZZQ6_EUMVA|nr:hypothetical protein EVAR_64978_1 [Eumeta japonica]